MSGLFATIQNAASIAHKDWQCEFRSKEILLSMSFFGLLVVLISAFAFYRGDVPSHAIAAGTLWVAITYSGTLGLGRAFAREREGECMRALLLSPAPRSSIFLGKLLGIVSFMLAIQLVVLPAVFVFFNQSVGFEQLWRLLLVIVLGSIGFGIVGESYSGPVQRGLTLNRDIPRDCSGGDGRGESDHRDFAGRYGGGRI